MLKRNIEELGLQPQDHSCHWDQVLSFAQLAQESSAELWIHLADRDQVTYDAKTKVAEARKQLGVYFNPWFKPMYETFQY